MASEGSAADFPIVDPHHHFWDLSRNYYPWLCDPKPVHFRYGDYSSLKRNYLLPDYRRDAGPLNIVKTVHIQANCDPSDPAGETRWLDEVARESGSPHALVGAAYLARDDNERVLAGHAKSKLTRGVRNFPAAAIWADMAVNTTAMPTTITIISSSIPTSGWKTIRSGSRIT